MRYVFLFKDILFPLRHTVILPLRDSTGKKLDESTRRKILKKIEEGDFEIVFIEQ